MICKSSKQRLYAGLLFLGAGILLFLTIWMLTHGTFKISVLWVSLLLLAEMILDLSCMLFSVRWWIADDAEMDRVPLQLGAAAAILHAVRVFIFVLGRVGPWIDFDVRMGHRALHHTRWEIGWVYFAAIMSVLGIAGVVVIWRIRRQGKKRTK